MLLTKFLTWISCEIHCGGSNDESQMAHHFFESLQSEGNILNAHSNLVVQEKANELARLFRFAFSSEPFYGRAVH